MTIKTKKRNTKRTLKGGSSKSYWSARASIKRSLGLTRVTDIKCNNEINKLKKMFQKLKEAYMTLERAHNYEMIKYNKTHKDYVKFVGENTTISASVSEKVVIKEFLYKSNVDTINIFRQNMNKIYLLFKRLRCVLVKYLFAKHHINLDPVFEEYSTIFTSFVELIKGNQPIIDLALIKECFKYYIFSNKDKTNEDFMFIFRRDILRLTKRDIKIFNISSDIDLQSLFRNYCKNQSSEDEIFEGHYLKFYNRLEYDLISKTILNKISEVTYNTTTTTVSGKKRKSKKIKSMKHTHIKA